MPLSIPATGFPPRSRWFVTAAASAVLIWVARYWYSAGFGLYEDDLARVPIGMETDLENLLAMLGREFRLVGTQGRPFHDGLIYVFSYLGGLWGGLRSVYAIGYAILVINTLLFHALLRRLRVTPFCMVAGTLAFMLFPANTTQAYLTTSFGSQPSLTCALLALHVYVTRYRPLSYVLVGIALFTYETTVPLVLLAPLLWESDWTRRVWTPLARHVAIVAAIVVGNMTVRTAFRAVVAPTPDLPTALLWPLRQMTIGPVVSMGMYAYRPVEALRWHETRHVLLLVPAFAAFTLALWRSGLETSPQPGRWRSLRSTALVGAMLLVLAYPLTFTTPAEIIDGRVTRGHLAAAVGGAILCACLLSAMVSAAQRFRAALLGHVVSAALITGLLAFALTIQDDYVKSWALQQTLWTDIARECQDLEDGEIILMEEHGLADARAIMSRGWALPEILETAYLFPSTWKTPPSVYALKSDWREVFASTGDIYEAIDLKSWVLRKPATPSFILLEVQDGRLVRREGVVSAGKASLSLKPRGASTAGTFPKRLLYRYLILPPALVPPAAEG